MRKMAVLLVILVACATSSAATVPDAGSTAPECAPGTVSGCKCADGKPGRTTCTSESKRGGCECSGGGVVDAADDVGDAGADVAPVDAGQDGQSGFGEPCAGGCGGNICAGSCKALYNELSGQNVEQKCWDDDTQGPVNMKGRCTFRCTPGPIGTSVFCDRIDGGCVDVCLLKQ